MDNRQILKNIKKIKENSVTYRKVYGTNNLGSRDEIGGHIGYTVQETEDHICPSDEFMNSLFEECAAGLGFEYEQR